MAIDYSQLIPNNVDLEVTACRSARWKKWQAALPRRGWKGHGARTALLPSTSIYARGVRRRQRWANSTC